MASAPLPSAAAPASRRAAGELGLLLVLATCAALVFLNRTGISFLFPAIQGQLHLTNTQLGQLMSATSLAWALSSVVCSLASDILGVRPRLLIVVCTIGFSIVGGLSGLVSSFVALLLLRVAMGVFEGPVLPLIQSTVSAVSPPGRRGANLGMIIGGSALVGAVLAPPIMTGLSATLGWRSAFLAIAIPGPLVALAVWIATRPRGLGGPLATERLDLRGALGFIRRRNIFLALVGAVTLIGSTVASAAFLPLYLSSLPAFSPTSKILFFMALGVIHSIGGIVLPALSDKMGRRACLIAACLCSTATPVALALMSLSAWWVAAVVVLGFVASGAFTLMIYVVPGETVPPQIASTTFAILLFVGEIIGGGGAPTLAGWVADHRGLAAAQLVCAALAGVAFIAALFVEEPPHAAPAPAA
ncbi:MAG TPA: MFS transporter [Caulobacter sp.]|nr:MFS transporter [Caulobacter sp.]